VSTIPSYISKWSQTVGEAISLLGTDDFFESFCQAYTSKTERSHPMVLYLTENARPRVLFTQHKAGAEYVRQVENYVNGPYILDPFYQASVKGIPAGAYRLSKIAPDNFKKTEYFRHFYRDINFNDEVSFIQDLPGNEYLHFSLCYRHRLPAQNMHFFRAVSPVTNALIRKHWDIVSSVQSADPSLKLHQTLKHSLQRFGSSVLTGREQTVLQLVLHGHSNKSAAGKLGITLATVKLHRKHIYKKLDIRSQAELFYLFIDSLSSSSSSGNDDPLKAYMNL